MDENTGQRIIGGSRPYNFESNSASMKGGIIVPTLIPSGSTFQISDNSNYASSATSGVQYFGPTGIILNNSYYILDPTKSDGFTPLDPMQYPTNSGTVLVQFWYKEATEPTLTIDAADQFGDILKTFSSSKIAPTQNTVTLNTVLPAAADTSIANNTLTSITVIKTNSVSGQADSTTTYQITPAEYASLLADTRTSYDYRLMGDYQNVEIQLGYTTNSIQLYIQPVDPKGNKIGDPIAVGKGVVGKNVTIFAPTLTGYAPMTHSVSTIVTADQGPIDFPYISATDIDPNDGGTYLYDGKFSSIPSNGIQVTNTGTVSTDPTAEHTISVQAVDTDGNPLGALIPVDSAEANTTYSLNWTSNLVKLLNNSVKNVSQYELWNASALSGEMDVPVANQDVVVDVIYALPKVTTTYNYVDMNTGKTLLTQTNTWNLDDPTNGSTFKTQGIRPPMTVIDSDSGQLVADDLSPTPQTNPADLPFFGPSGTVFNTGQYQLNSLMSGLTTPTRYITWPSANVTKTFYYMENPDPTITLDAVNQEGNVIKTFNAPTVVSTLPAPQLSPAADFPTVAQATINGYTLTGIQVHATGSYFGGTDTDYTYTLTPDQYAAFISSQSAQSTMDERALASHSNFGIHFTYTGNQKNLMVQPVDENGNKIGDPVSVGTGIVGSSATLTAPEIDNYKAVNATSTITVDPDQGTVDIPYTRMATTDPDTGNTGSGSTTDPGTGNTGSGSTTDPSTGDSGSGSTTDPDTGNTGSGSTTDPGTGNTGSGSTTDPATGNTSSGSSTDPNTGNTGSGSTIDPGTGNTGSGSTTDPDTGNTSSGSSTDPNTGNTGSGSTTDPGTGNTSSGSSTDPNTGNTGSSSTTNPNTGNSGSVTNPDTGNSGSGSTTDPDTGNTGSGSTTDPGTGNTSSGSSTDPGTGNSGSGSTTDPGTGDSGSGSTTDPDTGNTGSGSTTDPSTGNSGSGSTTDPDTGNTSSGSTTDPSTGNTSSGSTTDPSTGNSGSGSTTDPDTGNTSSGSTTDPSTGNTGSGSTTDPSTGNSGSGSTTDPGTGNTGSGSTTDPSTGDSGSGSTTDPDTGNTGSGSTSDPNTSNTGSGSTTDPDAGNSGSGSTTDPNTGNSGSSSTTDSNTGNSGYSSTTDPSTGNSGSGSTTEPDTGNSGSSSTTDPSSSNTNKDPSTDPNTINSGSNNNNGSSTGNSDSGVTTDSNVGNATPSTDSNDGITGSSSMSQSDNNNGGSVLTSTSFSTNNNGSNSTSDSTNPSTSVNAADSNKGSSSNTSKKDSQTSASNKLNATKAQLPNIDANAKLPQTGNKLALALSVAGFAILGVMGFCIKKIKKLI